MYTTFTIKFKTYEDFIYDLNKGSMAHCHWYIIVFVKYRNTKFQKKTIFKTEPASKPEIFWIMGYRGLNRV